MSPAHSGSANTSRQATKRSRVPCASRDQAVPVENYWAIVSNPGQVGLAIEEFIGLPVHLASQQHVLDVPGSEYLGPAPLISNPDKVRDCDLIWVGRGRLAGQLRVRVDK